MIGPSRAVITVNDRSLVNATDAARRILVAKPFIRGACDHSTFNDHFRWSGRVNCCNRPGMTSARRVREAAGFGPLAAPGERVPTSPGAARAKRPVSLSVKTALAPRAHAPCPRSPVYAAIRTLGEIVTQLSVAKPMWESRTDVLSGRCGR